MEIASLFTIKKHLNRSEIAVVFRQGKCRREPKTRYSRKLIEYKSSNR